MSAISKDCEHNRHSLNVTSGDGCRVDMACSTPPPAVSRDSDDCHQLPPTQPRSPDLHLPPGTPGVTRSHVNQISDDAEAYSERQPGPLSTPPSSSSSLLSSAVSTHSSFGDFLDNFYGWVYDQVQADLYDEIEERLSTHSQILHDLAACVRDLQQVMDSRLAHCEQRLAGQYHRLARIEQTLEILIGSWSSQDHVEMFARPLFTPPVFW